MGKNGEDSCLRSINLPLPSSAHLAPSLFAGFLIMFSGFENLKDSLTLNFLLKAFERLIKRLILTNLNSRHSGYLHQINATYYTPFPSIVKASGECNLFRFKGIEIKARYSSLN